MNKTKTMHNMKSFIKENENKVVLFSSLDSNGKYNYILIKSMMYYKKFLKSSEAFDRALKNAEAHRKSNFENFDTYGVEKMVISD